MGRAISDIIDYVENPEKTDNGRLISSFQCDSRIADAEFLLSKRQYQSRTGRQRGADDVIAYQIRQSFVPGEITPEEANRLGYELARRFTKGNHAFIVCTHVDKAHVHNHIIWNSTSLNHDRKFRDFLGSARAMRRLSDTICVQNGYSIVTAPKRRGKSYDKWLGSKPPSYRDQLRMAIDAALAQKPADLDTLWRLLQDAGIEVSPRGKSVRLKMPGGKRFIRLDVAYRKAGYSKKFKAEHESEILLHQAAKKFFDESGMKKLPTVKSLQAEYAALLAEKKDAYADYRKARDDMKELLTVQANVQKLMGDEVQEQKKDTERREDER